MSKQLAKKLDDQGAKILFGEFTESFSATFARINCNGSVCIYASFAD